MKTVIFTLAALAMHIWTMAPAHAASYGTLVSTQPFKLELNSTNTGLANGTVTVYWLKEGDLVNVELLLGKKGPTFPVTIVTIPRRTSRVIYHVSPSPNGGTINLHLSQVSTALDINETVQTDTFFVFDVE